MVLESLDPGFPAGFGGLWHGSFLGLVVISVVSGFEALGTLMSVGLMMLPVKALDTLQPIFGLVAFTLLLFYLVTGRLALALPVGGIILAKITLDFAFHLWSIHLYRGWVDPNTLARLDRAILASLAEPFTFQILRHAGAALGWLSFLTGQRKWGGQSRLGLTDARQADGPA